MSIFDLKAALAVAGRGEGSVAAIQTAFGVPSCIRNLSNDILAALPTSVLFGMSSELESGVTLADDVVKSIFSVIRDEFGIIEWDTEEGGFTFISKANKNAYDANNGNKQNELAALVNGVAGLAGRLYSNYNLAANQIAAIQDCINSYSQYLRFKDGNAGTEIAKLDPVAFENYINEKYGVERSKIQEALDFIASTNQQLEAISDVIASRISDPSLEPKFSCSALPYFSGTSLANDCDVPPPEEKEMFRLVYGPPRSTFGQFVLSKDGVYFDSQTSGITPALVYVDQKAAKLNKSDKWRFGHAPNVGGRGDAFSTQDLQLYINTILDPSIVDDSQMISTYYTQDGFLQELIGQRNKRVYDLSAQIIELETSSAPESIIYNQRQSLISESSFHLNRINKRKKQIELAVKLPSIYNSNIRFSPGEVPINDFSYLAGSNIALDIQKQKALSFSQVDIKDVVSPLNISPIYSVPKVVSKYSTVEHLILPTLGDGAIIYDGSSVSATNSIILPIEHSVVTDKIIAMYNFLDTNIEDPSSAKFTNRNAISESNEKYAQLVAEEVSEVFRDGLGIPFFDGVVKINNDDLTSYSSVGSYLKLPQVKEFQDLLYNKNGASIDFWIHTPQLDCSTNGWNDNDVPGHYRIILACENTGGSASSTTLNQFGNQTVRGFLMGLTKDVRLTENLPGTNVASGNPTSSTCFFIAPTQSTDASTVNFVSRSQYDNDSCVATNSYHLMKQNVYSISNGLYLSSMQETFCHLAVTFNPVKDEIKFYQDGTLIATSAISNVFGIEKYRMPNLPTFKKTNSFEYSGGPYLDQYFTPWIVGGGYTDGFSGGNFLGNGFGGSRSGLKGYLGSLKFYSKPLEQSEVLDNYNAQRGFFKNINMDNLDFSCIPEEASTPPELIPFELYSPGVESLRSSMFAVSAFDNVDYSSMYLFSTTARFGEGGVSGARAAYGRVDPTNFSEHARNRLWFYDDKPVLSYATFGTPSATLIRVSKPGEAITSVDFRPRSKNYDASFVGNDIEFMMSPMDKAWLTINGDVSNTLFIFADPPKPAIPVGSILYFGSGIHHLSALAGAVVLSKTSPYSALSTDGLSRTETFYGASFSAFDQHDYADNDPYYIYLDGGAYVIGQFDFRGKNNITVMGPGIVAGDNVVEQCTRYEDDDFHLRGTTDGILQQFRGVRYAYGENGIFTFEDRAPSGLVVSGPTIVNSHHLHMPGINVVANVKILSPFMTNTDIKAPMPDNSTSAAVMKDCFIFLGDDAIIPTPYNAYPTPGALGMNSEVYGYPFYHVGGRFDISGCHVYTTNGGPLVLPYFGTLYPSGTDRSYPINVYDCDFGVLTYNEGGGGGKTGLPVNDGRYGECAIRMTMDMSSIYSGAWSNGKFKYGLENVTVSNIRFDEPIDQALIMVGNVPDPYFPTPVSFRGEEYGSMSGITFADITVSVYPEFATRAYDNLLYSKDSTNRATNILFKNIKFNNEYLTSGSFPTYFNTSGNVVTGTDAITFQSPSSNVDLYFYIGDSIANDAYGLLSELQTNTTYSGISSGISGCYIFRGVSALGTTSTYSRFDAPRFEQYIPGMNTSPEATAIPYLVGADVPLFYNLRQNTDNDIYVIKLARNSTIHPSSTGTASTPSFSTIQDWSVSSSNEMFDKFEDWTTSAIDYLQSRNITPIFKGGVISLGTNQPHYVTNGDMTLANSMVRSEVSSSIAGIYSLFTSSQNLGIGSDTSANIVWLTPNRRRLQELPSLTGSPTFSANWMTYIDNTISTIRDYAITETRLAEYNPSGYYTLSNTGDYYHPNTSGQLLIGEAIYDIFYDRQNPP